MNLRCSLSGQWCSDQSELYLVSGFCHKGVSLFMFRMKALSFSKAIFLVTVLLSLITRRFSATSKKVYSHY